MAAVGPLSGSRALAPGLARCSAAFRSQRCVVRRASSSSSPEVVTHLTITRPDDWHLHVRDGAALRAVVPATASQYRRAIIMPNLVPPVTTTAMALQYRDRILAAAAGGTCDASAAASSRHDFEPLMTLYLTDSTTPDDVAEAAASGRIVAYKLYPAGATTNSDSGVTDWRRTLPTVRAMAQVRDGGLRRVHGGLG